MPLRAYGCSVRMPGPVFVGRLLVVRALTKRVAVIVRVRAHSDHSQVAVVATITRPVPLTAVIHRFVLVADVTRRTGVHDILTVHVVGVAGGRIERQRWSTLRSNKKTDDLE